MSTKLKFNASMFEKIKDVLNKTPESGSSAFTNIMKFPAGHTYTLRLIPNLENIEKTFFHHFVHNMTSKATGSFMSALSLQTFGERDPIAEARWKLYKSENPKEKELAKDIQRKEQWMLNVYVVEDPSNPENNGTVKILRFGPQIKKIIDDAMEGEGAEEFGSRIFDLGKDGVNLKIKAEKQGDYTTFQASRFSSVPRIDLDEDQQEKIYSSIHDLEQIYPVKTFDELKDILDEHFFCDSVKTSIPEERKPLTSKPTPSSSKKVVDEDEDDDIPMSHSTDDDEIDVDALLAGLND